MKKRILTVGIVAILLLAFYTTAFSNDGSKKDYVDFPEADYSNGEKFVYGSIQKLNYENNEMIIEQHLDDNSLKISPILKVKEDVIVILQRSDKKMNIDFEDLKVGDKFGIVLDRLGVVRGIIINV
ncbi:hypothetical protein K8M07_11820 [Schnuerera sp. xch1]|uniref:hypothetical protein n=1 Tax=Schnuerera sp. xch1 TaxID=2874283 RepID=UPI001CC07D4B|nr:hypothetical protein [Schnuerera sp. xch1]MBZ2175925.1 hypothetical protein [Schnuerera sp. xch1]